MDNANIQTGIQHFKSGNKTDALQIFLQVLKQEPNNEVAWLWLAACVDKPEQKRDCFYKVLAINPKNTNAQKALAELELQSMPDTKPIPQLGTVLKCPSCGSVMGKPDHTGLVQCGYCGTTITYHPPVEKVERKNVERFLELCKVAIDGSNYDEALQYSNKILEIDPENFNAWIYKAVSIFWQTTAANNRYDEAMGYLQIAENINKDDPVILETKIYLSTNQSRWYQHLGDTEREHAIEIFEIYNDGNDFIDSVLGNSNPEAKSNSQEYFQKAMEYYMLASQYGDHGYDYSSQNFSALRSIYDLAQETKWINWWGLVKQKKSLYLKVQLKNYAISMALPDLRKQLQEASTTLSKTKKEKGLFVGVKINSLTKKIKSLQEQIVQEEKNANTEIKRE